MNRQELEGNWKKLKGRAREKWGELTDDDLDRVEGKADRLIGTIQERYGKTKDAAAEEVADFLDALEEDVSEESKEKPSASGRTERQKV